MKRTLMESDHTCTRTETPSGWWRWRKWTDLKFRIGSDESEKTMNRKTLLAKQLRRRLLFAPLQLWMFGTKQSHQKAVYKMWNYWQIQLEFEWTLNVYKRKRLLDARTNIHFGPIGWLLKCLLISSNSFSRCRTSRKITKQISALRVLFNVDC